MILSRAKLIALDLALGRKSSHVDTDDMDMIALTYNSLLGLVKVQQRGRSQIISLGGSNETG